MFCPSNTPVTTQNLARICLFAAPADYLMYFKDLEGHVSSFNYNPNLSNSKWHLKLIQSIADACVGNREQ
jgi:hypothetical protein